jgi:hypothetical protein
MSRGAASRDARKLFALRRDRLGNEHALLYLNRAASGHPAFLAIG